MRLALISIVAALAVLAGNTPVQAAPILPGDTVRLADGPGTTGGGEFYLTVNGDTFITFCVQRTEYIDFVNPFKVDAVSTYAISDPSENGGDGEGKDELSAQSAYLYTMFRAGTLYQYDYTPAGRVASANELQNAIWMFEEELHPIDTSNRFVNQANEAVANHLWSGQGNVRVLNLSYMNGKEAQDQLMILPVPEPSSSLLLLGCGLGTVFAARRRWTTDRG